MVLLPCLLSHLQCCTPLRPPPTNTPLPHSNTTNTTLKKALELRLTTASNEARDNARYLASLEPALAVLYGGAGPAAIRAALRGLLTAVCTVARIARFYGTRERMTALLAKICNQIVRACRDFLLAPGGLWDQPRPALIASMRACKELCEAARPTFLEVRAEVARGGDDDDGKVRWRAGGKKKGVQNGGQ